MTRIIGPIGSGRWRWSLLGATASVLLLSLLVLPNAAAVHDLNVFELDASLADPAVNTLSPVNTDNSTTGLPDDWDRVCDTASTTQCTGAGADHATARSFDIETTSTGGANNASIFTGGGSKDPQELSEWKWKDATGGLPDKDNLLHAMSARYTCVAADGCTGTPGDQYLYFGSDRFDNSGDAQVGFWFFRNAVTLDPAGTFNGTHSAGKVPHDASNPGDILILSDFTQGGTQPTISIYEFVGPCTGCSGTPSNGTLNLIGGGILTTRDCASVPAGDAFCASVNRFDGQDPPWLFLNKSGQTTYGHGEFYEGGLNLNQLGLQNECFSSFLAETRSSQSTTATLKDFVLGTFQVCAPTLATTPSAGAGGTVAPGASVTDTLTITGAGVTNPPFPNSDESTGGNNVKFFMCGLISSGTCDGTTGKVGTQVGPAAGEELTATSTQGVSTSTSAAVNTSGSPLSPGRYCFRAEWPGDSTYKPTPPATKFSESGTGNGECFIVQDTSSVTSAQTWLPNDSATVASGGGTPLNGTLSFTLYDHGSGTVCTGTQLYPVPATTTLAANATASATQIAVTSASGFPTSGNFGILVGTEIMSVTGGQGTTTWTVSRGLAGTTAAAHTIGDSVSLVSQDFALANATSLADRTKTTTNSAVTVAVTKNVSWKVVFTSSDTGVSSPSGPKCETTSLTITN